LWQDAAIADQAGHGAAMERAMYKNILVPVDLADPNLAKPSLESAVMLAKASAGHIRLINVLPLTPAMLAEYVPPDFDAQQRKSAEEALSIIANEIGLGAGRVSTAMRQGGIYHEILEEAKEFKADLIVMSSHRVGVRTYFLGSVAGHVVRYAACSVLVVRR
jgi:nucleotide-binding universal stress UspA family protein